MHYRGKTEVGRIAKQVTFFRSTGCVISCHDRFKTAIIYAEGLCFEITRPKSSMLGYIFARHLMTQ